MSIATKGPQARRDRGISGEVSQQTATSPALSKTTKASDGYLFSKWLDWFFVANLAWPVVLLADWSGGVSTHEGMLFWQIYFITAPHRWITILLVSVDHHKSQDRRWLFGSLALAIIGICAVVQFGTGSLLCLGMIDTIWNAWHFASQHHGVFRIYQRRTEHVEANIHSVRKDASLSRDEHLNSRAFGGLASRWHKALYRGYVLYVIARVVGWGWDGGTLSNSLPWLAVTDGCVLVLPAVLILSELREYLGGRRSSIASCMHLISVMVLFTGMLAAAHFEKSQWIIHLALASAIFHSVEYLSVVTWSMQSNSKLPAGNPLHRLSKMWMLFLAIFIVVIGVGNYVTSQGYFEAWVFVNLVVAFWHYCFDGLLWRAPRNSASGGARSRQS